MKRSVAIEDKAIERAIWWFGMMTAMVNVWMKQKQVTFEPVLVEKGRLLLLLGVVVSFLGSSPW